MGDLPRISVVRIAERLNMISAVYHGCKAVWLGYLTVGGWPRISVVRIADCGRLAPDQCG